MVKDVAIIGGGLAGGAAATLLARQGWAVRLVERERGAHDKVCGEFLSVEAWQELARIGLDVEALGAVPIRTVRIVSGEREAPADLPFAAYGISRRVLDEALLDLAGRSGAVIERGVRVTAIKQGHAESTVGRIDADAVILATGKHDVRGAARQHGRGHSDYAGFKMHWRTSSAYEAALGDAIELVLFKGGYAGIQRVAPGVVNLCLIARKDRLAKADGTWDGLLAGLADEPGVARLVEGSQPLFEKPLAIAGLPYGYLCDPGEALGGPIYRVGDQAAMTASLTGDGMAGALHSARLCAEALAEGLPPNAYHRRVRRAVGGQVRRAMALQRIAESRVAIQGGFSLAQLFPKLLEFLATATRLPAGKTR